MLKHALKIFQHWLSCIGKLLYQLVYKVSTLFIPFSMPSMVYLIWVTNINLKTFKKYLREFKCTHADKQAKWKKIMKDQLIEGNINFMHTTNI